MSESVLPMFPWRIVDDCGGAFTMGTIGGGIFQAIKGFRNSPVGVNHRLRGSLTAVKTRAPQLGGLNNCLSPSESSWFMINFNLHCCTQLKICPSEAGWCSVSGCLCFISPLIQKENMSVQGDVKLTRVGAEGLGFMRACWRSVQEGAPPQLQRSPPQLERSPPPKLERSP
ncbi:hypothetical protein FD755_023481, partial [Muntiacus reevesi]